MYCSVYFPIADFRGILDAEDKLKSPAWPLPDQNKAFIRNFGCVKTRILGGSEDWIGEDNFCDASGMFIYDNLIAVNRNSLPYFQIKPVHKRFYSDGYLTNRFEVAIKINCDDKKFQPFTKISLLDALRNLATLPVKIYSSKEKNILIQSSAGLAVAYFESTTSSKSKLKVDNRLIMDGEPIIIATYLTTERISLPSSSKEISYSDIFKTLLGETRIHSLKINCNDFVCKVWLIGLSDNYHKGQFYTVTNNIRNLRINLSRIHIEKEIIRLALNALKTKRITLSYSSPEFSKFEKYIKLQSEKILKKRRYNLPQSNLLNFALSNDQSMSGGVYNSLKNEIAFFQDKILQKNLDTITEIEFSQCQPVIKTSLTPQIFFSYAWGGEKEKIVNELYSSLGADQEYLLMRDKQDINYKDSILSFMQKIGRGNLVVVVLSDKYITSEYCMFELNELYKNSNQNFDELINKIFPIRVEELSLNDPETLKKYFSFWIEKEKGYRELIDSIPADIGLAQHKEYRKIKAIKDNIGDLLNGLHYVNTLSPEILSKNNFEIIKNAIKQRTKAKKNN